MIYIELVEDGEHIGFTHYAPFDETYGLGKSVDELKETGILVDKLPDMNELPGKIATLKYDKGINELYYEYIDRPLTSEEELKRLKDFLKTADQKYKELDVSTATLEALKAAKMAQLNELCNLAIVNGFDYEVNGESYHFSCSLSAQANFTGTDILFKDNLIQQSEWTVINNTTGKDERVTLDQTTFNSVKLQVFQHINSNVAKFRNTLQPQVEAATTNTEVDAIVW
jgi:hypothetical protein